MDKKLSIIIPLYNVEPYVHRAAESIAAQAFDGLEVILVDDGSTDNSSDTFIKHAPGINVTTIKQKNTGPGGARNTGICAASGDYIMFIDGDDFLLPSALQNILTALEKEQPDVLFGRYLRWMPDAGLLKSERHQFNPPKDPRLRTEYILSVFPEPSWNSAWRYICRRDFILQQELFFEPTMYCEDMKWVLELLYAVEMTEKKLSFLPEPFYAYNYRRPGSIMNGTSPKRLIDLTAIIAEALEKYQDRPEICKELIWQVFYYINEYCTFGKVDRKEIYRGYKKVLPLFGLSRVVRYKLTSWCQNPVLFYGLSIGLFIGKYARRIWRYGV